MSHRSISASKAAGADPGRVEEPGPTNEVPAIVRVAIVGVFIILVFAVLYVARTVFLPIVLAVLFTITLSPLVRALDRRRIPPPVTAVMLVAGLALGTASGAYLLSGPVMTWIEAAPQIGQQVQRKLIELRRPAAAIAEASEAAEEITEAPPEDAQEVVVRERGMLRWVASGLAELLTAAGFTFVLLVFLLASGTALHEKIIGVLPTLSDKKRALRIVYDVEYEVSRYLLTISLINGTLGAVIASGMWLAGMPNPVLWGVAAALLNFIPFLGAALGIALVAIVALVSFDTIAQAALPPAFYFACTAIEGGIVTPLIVGRRLALNSVAVIVALALWTWLWGLAGTLIAVPLLVAIKAFCDHFEALQAVGQFLSAPPSMTVVDDNSSDPA